MKKVLSIMLVTLMLISTMFTATVFAVPTGVPATSTRYAISIGRQTGFTRQFNHNDTGVTETWFDGYPGQALNVRNHNATFSETGNHIVSAEEGKELVLYIKYDISALAGKTIDFANVLVAPNNNTGNFGKTFSIHSVNIDAATNPWPANAASSELAPNYESDVLDTFTMQAQTGFSYNGTDKADFNKTKGGSGSDFAYCKDADGSEGFDVKTAVQAAVNAGKTEIAFAISRDSSGYGTWSQHFYPGLLVYASDAAATPEVELTADKASYTTTDTSAVITDNVTGATPSSYTFTVNNTAINELTGMTGNVAGNELTLSNLTAGTHTIKVECAADGVSNFSDEISITVADQANVTPTTVEIESLNGYDGKLFAEWNQSTGGYTATGTSFAFDGRTDKRKSVFMRIPLANIKTANIKSARLLVGYAVGFNDTTINLYTFDESLWSTTTAPTVTRTDDNKMYYKSTRANITSATDSDFESGWSYYEIIDDAKLNANSAFTMTEAVKNAIKAGDDYLCLVIEPNGTSYGTFYASDAGKPRLQVYISDNDIPVASLSITDPKAYYAATDSIVLNAGATDNHSADGFTYEYYLDDSETPIAGADTAAPSIALTGLAGGQHKITVKVTDKYGDAGEASVTFEVLGAVIKTPNTVAMETLNGYDGFKFTDWTNSTGTHNNSNSWYLDGNAFVKSDTSTAFTDEELDTDAERDAAVSNIKYGKKSVYMRVDVSQFASQNVSTARLLIAFNSGLKGTLNIYTFDEDKWSTERAPIVDRTTKAIEYATGDVTTITDPDFDSSWKEYKELIDMTDLVKKTIAKGDQYLCFVLEPNGAAYGTFWKSENNKARIQVYTTTNNVPTVSLAADKTFYDGTTPAVITATANDADAWDTTLTHTFYINGVEVNQDYQGASVADNKLTIATYDGSDMEIIVKSSDSKDYGLAILNLKKNMNFEINEPAITGTIGSTDLTATYTVTNKNTTDALNLIVIVAAYDVDGKLVGVKVDSTQSVGADTTAPLTAVTLQNANITGTPVKAVSMIWDKDTFAPLRAATDF